MTGLAEVKGVAIRLTKEAEEARRQASEYERKAMLMLQRAQAGHLDMAQAEHLATEALTMKESASERATRLCKDTAQQQQLASQLQEKIAQFKSTISTYENELITLRARATTAAATKKINQQLSQLDSSSTIALLECMKNNVEEDEALAQAYGEVAKVETDRVAPGLDTRDLRLRRYGAGNDEHRDCGRNLNDSPKFHHDLSVSATAEACTARS